MKRGVFLLLFVLTAWLFTLPAGAMARLPAAAPGVVAHDGKAGVAAVHVAAQPAMPHVARAPRLLRLSIASQLLPRAALAFARLPALRPTPDLRQAVRRARTRRRVPRLRGGEPPWC